ncbi:MAG: hypothetical protein JRI59_04765 [Deltaproteobacteria bacterium]|nr:hypothetical protein [Deltaproteobacteria bacterium]
MGFLEVCVDALDLTGKYDLSAPGGRLFAILMLVAAIFLCRALKKSRQDQDRSPGS